ncbi:MAG: choice-of-anchor I family protein [Planctomycetes bacterium]|nr:choice-of-anchor I family protein [Planctomycetota bacterium]
MLHKLPLFVCGLALVAVAFAGCSSNDDDDDSTSANVSSPQATVLLGLVGRYNSGLFDADGGGAEITAFDPGSQRAFVTNAIQQQIDVLDLSDPANPSLILSIDVSPYGGGSTPSGAPNSVAVGGGILAIAVEQGGATDAKQQPGQVVFFNANDATFATPLNTVTVGALPDMVTFTPDNTKALVANEGEPNDAYTVDPEGSISIIDLSAGVASATVTTATFTSFNAQKAALIAAGVRIFGPESTIDEPDDIATVAQDLEPEYITCNNTTAWVTLQEANAIAIVDIASSTVTSIVPLGYKDHSLAVNQFDPSDRDGPMGSKVIKFVTGPVRGLYMPDTIASYSVGGQTYLVTANEGDSRDYGGFSEEERVKDLTLDAAAYPNAAAVQADGWLGRLKCTTATGDTDNDGDIDQIYCYGARSFSIWSSAGQLVWDSGDQLEQIVAATLPNNFNANNDSNGLDGRSDDKGPEPEAVAVAEIDGRWYAFIGLERVSGIVVYDITSPSAPVFQQYINTRDFNVTPASNGAGNPVDGLDIGPEGMRYVSAADSPTGEPLLIVGNEVSGSTTIFKVTKALGN